jgi:DNA-binding MarR family transcriptional regulator
MISAAVTTSVDVSLIASDLRVVLGQLLRRLRAERTSQLSLAQGIVLGRLDREGPMGTSDLAAAERVRPQSMAQTVSELEADGLVDRRPDPADGRRALIELTKDGRRTLQEDRQQREGWLIHAIAEGFSEAEQRALAEAVALLRRLADS